MNTSEIHDLVNRHSYIIITPDGVGSKGDEAMICGCLSILQGRRSLLVTPNRALWCDELLGKTHLFDECCVPIEDMPQLFRKPHWLIMLGADTLDGSCGYEAAHWRLESLKAAVANGGKAVVFCSIRSDMDQRLIDEWKEVPDSVMVFLRDTVSEENFANQIGRPAQHFSDLSFFAEPLHTARVNAFCEQVRQTAQGKRIIGLQMSETMFRSFHTVVTDEKRKEFAWHIASLASEGLSAEDTIFVLLTHDTRSWSEHWSDHQFACAAAERLGGVEGFTYLIQPPELTQGELLNVLSLCDLLICGRMHMSVTACYAGTVPLIAAGKGKNYVMVDKVRGMCREWLGTDQNLTLDPEQIPALRDKMLSTDFFEKALADMRSSLPERLTKERAMMRSILGVHPVQIQERDACEEALINAMSRSAGLARALEAEEALRRNKEAHIELLLQSERDLQNKNSALTDVCHQAEEISLQLRGKLASAEGECRQLRDKENALKAELSEIKLQHDILSDRVVDYSNSLDRMREVEEELRGKLLCSEGECAQLRDRENQLKHELACREGECQQLRDKENQLKNDLEATRNSRTWRLARVFAGFVRFFVPVGSKRALILRLLWTFIKHPIKFLKNLSPRKIKKFFRLLRRGDVEGIKMLIHSNITGMPAPSSLEVTVPEVVAVETAPAKEKTIDDYPVLQVPQWGEPQVSIVIPVYNQFEFTYHCVESIIKNSGDVTYEIIIANDCSSDLTTQIDKILPGVNCITNEKNLRFLLNCNNAARYAKGQYILFLNNDTQVQANWLEPLVTLIESADDIGMVGSKLIYPDGTLQEAGGIFWKDGSAWNYGNRQNPAEPQFNYVKQVDYISGAAIMLSRKLWEEVGGFDETFAPAYCEDSDLAFTIRKMGYRVMYQPLSVVVHFEGVSNGTDLSSGQKAYQVINQKKFLEKWHEELSKHPDNGVNVFQARDYSYDKKTVLIIDHYVPKFDQDAGSRTIFQYVKLFVSQGYNVKFIGDNFYQHEPYTTVLQQMGVEVLYGPWYANHWKEWIRENAEHIDYVFLSRPHISIKYVDFLRENTKAKLVYYGHDLHFWRAQREYEMTGDPEQLVNVQTFKDMEFSVYKKVDMVYYLSDLELDLLRSMDPTIPLRRNPINIFDPIDHPPYDPDERRDLLFVGGFAHHPNVDAATFLVDEILPIVKKQYPDVKVHLVGSHPPKQIQAMAGPNVIVEGFVSDERLAELYQQCRIGIVPLRFGAGVKGKVIEAMRYGLPVVTTDIGAEGIPDVEDILMVGNTAEELAALVTELHDDGDKLVELSKAGWAYVQENLSVEAAIRILGNEFDFSSAEESEKK